MQKTICCISLFLAIAIPTRIVFSQDSNQGEVRAALAANGWQVAYGKKFTELEWVSASASLYASVQSGSPGPFLEWMQSELEGSVQKISSQIPGLSKDKIIQLIGQSLKEGKVVQINGLDFQAGVATYERWKEVGAHYPEFGPWGVKWTYGSTRTALPNWHDPYIRFRINTQSGSSGKPPIPELSTGDGGISYNRIPPRAFAIHPQSIRIRCVDKQEAGGDDIYLIVKADGQIRNIQDVAGIGPKLHWKMKDGETNEIARSGLDCLDFVRYLEIVVVEYDSLSDNEILGTLQFEAGKNEIKTINHGNFPRQCRYEVTVNAATK